MPFPVQTSNVSGQDSFKGSCSERPCSEGQGRESGSGWRRMMLSATAGLAVLAMTATVATARPAPDSFADLAERLLPSVVNISTTQVQRAQERGPEIPRFPPGSPFEEFFRDFFDRNQQERAPRRITSLGSGFIIDPEGYIVTNNHVIEDAEEITVILHDDTNLQARIVGRDASTDLALLKVDPSSPLPHVSWGDSEAARVGDWILAIGNPFGLGGTVTAGIISASKRDINTGPYDSYLQTDASINRGNSGGPMFNLEGKVIGVNTAIFSPSGGSIGIGFAIPASLASNVIGQLRDYGRTRRGWLGVRIQTVTPDIAGSLQLERAEGALVAGITEGGPASGTGLRPGDVILSFDGRPIREMRDLPRIVADTPIDKEVTVGIWRNGEAMDLTVRIGELPDDAASRGVERETGVDSMEVLGLSLAPLSDELRRRFGYDSRAEGVVVLDVREGTPGKAGGLQEGDLIVEVTPEPVTTPEEFRTLVEKARDAGRKTVLLLTERNTVRQFLVMPVTER